MRSRVSITRSKGRTRLLRSASRSSATLFAEKSTACSAGAVVASAVLRAWLWAFCRRPPERAREPPPDRADDPALDFEALDDLAREPPDFAREPPPDFAREPLPDPADVERELDDLARDPPDLERDLRTSSPLRTSPRPTCAVLLDRQPCLLSLAGNPL